MPAATVIWPYYLGPELITNGTFDSDASGWTLQNMAWSSGKIVSSTTSVAIATPNVSVSSTKNYRTGWVLSDWILGTLFMRSNASNQISFTDNGSHEYDWNFTQSGAVDWRKSSGTNRWMSLDDVSLKEIVPVPPLPYMLQIA